MPNWSRVVDDAVVKFPYPLCRFVCKCKCGVALQVLSDPGEPGLDPWMEMESRNVVIREKPYTFSWKRSGRSDVFRPDRTLAGGIFRPSNWGRTRTWNRPTGDEIRSSRWWEPPDYRPTVSENKPRRAPALHACAVGVKQKRGEQEKRPSDGIQGGSVGPAIATSE